VFFLCRVTGVGLANANSYKQKPTPINHILQFFDHLFDFFIQMTLRVLAVRVETPNLGVSTNATPIQKNHPQFPAKKL